MMCRPRPYTAADLGLM